MKVGSAHVLLAALAAGVLGLVASLWWRGAPLQQHGSHPPTALPSGVTPAKVGDALPDIVLPDLSGTRQALAALRGQRPMLVNVWASWCGPCIEEMPELERFSRVQGANGTQVIGLALDSPASVQQFLARVPVGYPILLDTPGPADASVWLGNDKGVLPYSVLVGADGRILKRKVGPFAQGEIDAWAKP